VEYAPAPPPGLLYIEEARGRSRGVFMGVGVPLPLSG